MKQDLLQKINKGFLYIFVTFWSVFLFADYFVHEKFISKAFNNVTVSAILPVLLIIFSALFYLHKKKSEPLNYKKMSFENINGWKLFVLFIVSLLAYVITYAGFVKAFENSSKASIFNYIILIVTQLFYLSLIIMPAFVSGSFILDIFPTSIENKKSKLFIALALGFVVNGMLLFLLASIHALTSISVIVLMLAICGLGYKRFLVLSKVLFLEKSSIINLNWLGFFSLFVLLVYFIININSSLRPIPIGFDELSLYMNTPKLMAGYHGLTQGGQAYQWSIWMSLGFILDDSVPLATLISILPGIMACYLIYRIARVFTDVNFALLATIIFYSIPTTIWQSSADAKVDLALVFFTLAAVLLLLESNKKSDSRYVASKLFDRKLFSFFNAKIWLNIAILLGVILGYSFGIKYTAIFFIIAIMAGYLYQYSQSLSLATAVTAFGIAFIFLGKLYTFSGIEFENDAQVKLLGFVFVLLAMGLMAFHFYTYRQKFLKGSLFLFVIGAFIFITFLPWMLKHYNENKSFSITNLLNGKSPLESPEKILSFGNPQVNYRVKPSADRLLLAQLNSASDDKHVDSLLNYYKNVDQGTGKFEEVIRYIGYEKGVPKYLSVFYDLGTFQNVPNLPTDIGLFLLILFPLLFFSLRKGSIYSNIYNISMLIFILLVSIASLYVINGNIDGASFKTHLEKIKSLNPDHNHFMMSIYVLFASILDSIIHALKPLLLTLFKTNPVNSFLFLLGIIVSVTLINYKVIAGWKPGVKMVFIIGGSSFIMWWFFGSGITWYALPAFAICVPVLMAALSDKENGILGDQYLRFPVYFIIAAGLLIMLLFRQESMVVTYSYDPKAPSNSKINPLFLNFSHGEYNADECLEVVNKVIANTAEILNADEEGKIIRIGTSMNYFINNNDKRVYEDNQVDLFNKVYQKWYGTKDLISDNFVKNNVRYILFDFATGNIDNTPDKSLTKKVTNFYDYISANPRIQVMNTDRLVEDPNSKEMFNENGVQVPASFSIFGTRVIQPGSILLLKINE